VTSSSQAAIHCCVVAPGEQIEIVIDDLLTLHHVALIKLRHISARSEIDDWLVRTASDQDQTQYSNSHDIPLLLS